MQVAYAGISTVVFVAYYLPDLYKWIQSQTSMPPGAFCTSKQAVLGSLPTAEAAAGAELRRRQLSGVYEPHLFPAPRPLSVQLSPLPPPLVLSVRTSLTHAHPLRPLLSAATTSPPLPSACSCCFVVPATRLIWLSFLWLVTCLVTTVIYGPGQWPLAPSVVEGSNSYYMCSIVSAPGVKMGSALFACVLTRQASASIAVATKSSVHVSCPSCDMAPVLFTVVQR